MSWFEFLRIGISLGCLGVAHPFIVVNTGSCILQKSLWFDDNVQLLVSTTHVNESIAAFATSQYGCLLWAVNRHDGSSYLARLCDTSRASQVLIKDVGRVSDMVYDPENDTLYWLDTIRMRIEACYVADCSNRYIVYDDNVVREGTAVSIDIARGMLYWSDIEYYSHETRLMRGHVSGDIATVDVIVKGSPVTFSILAFTVDRYTGAVYFLDDINDAIWTLDLDGQSRVDNITRMGVIKNGHHLTEYGNNIYWTDGDNGHVNTLDKFTGEPEHPELILHEFVNQAKILFI